MKGLIRVALMSAVLTLPHSKAFAYNADGIWGGILGVLQLCNSEPNPQACAYSVLSDAYYSWEYTRNQDIAELETLQMNGGCTSNPSYCDALEDDIQEVGILLGYIAGYGSW